MLSISENAKGFLVTSTNLAELKELTLQLEREGVAGDVRTYRGSMSLPAARGVELLALAPSALWTEGARARAEDLSKIEALQTRARLEVEEAMRSPGDFLAGLDILPELDECQREAVAAMTVPSLVGMAIFDEQGVGKTAMSIAAFHRLRTQGLVKKLLVVTPKTTIGAWLQEFERLLPGRYVVRACAGSRASRRNAVLGPHDVLLMTYDAISADTGLVKMAVGIVPNSYMLIVDESFMVKNASATRSQAVRSVRNLCQRAIILCGTPAPNTPSDIVAQIDVADMGIAFRGVDVPQDWDDATVVVREALANTIYLRRMKSEVLPFVPEKNFETRYLPLAPAQEALYGELRDGLVADLKSSSDQDYENQRMSFLARRSALLQVCSHPGALFDSYAETPAKLLYLDELLDALMAEGEKVVLWSFYRFSLAALESRYAHKGVVRVDGSVVSAQERAERIRRFQTDPAIRLFIGNAAAAGAGITLTAGRHAIYESLSNQGAHYMQSLDRIHRRGQTRDVTFHLLICKGTVEEKHLALLLEKERMSRELLPRTQPPLTRQSLLEELEVR